MKVGLFVKIFVPMEMVKKLKQAGGELGQAQHKLGLGFA